MFVAVYRMRLDPDHEERAIYLVDGEIEIAGDRYEGPRLLIFRPGDRITVNTIRPTRMMFLGGDALEGPRHLWWNFVSSSKERIVVKLPRDLDIFSPPTLTIPLCIQ